MYIRSTQAVPTQEPTELTDVHPLGWGRFVYGAFSRAFLGFCGSLLIMALVPLVVGWKVYMVPTASMQPSINPGDLIVGSPVDADTELAVGQVIIADDPGHPGRTKAHRITQIDEDGTVTTKGDSNGSADPQPVTKSDIHSLSRLRVPFIGLPALWLQQRALLQLVGFIAAFALAIIGALISLDEHRQRDDDDASDDVDHRPGDLDHDPVWGDEGDDARRRWWSDRPAARAGALASIVIIAAAAIALPYDAANAALSTRTTNAGNTWASARSFYPYPTAVLADSPYLYWLLDETAATTAADFSGNAHPGTYVPTYTMNQADGLANNPGTALLLAANGAVVCGTSVVNPTMFSLELWFKTNTTTGGKLIGFESTTGATSPTFDRHIYMRNNGRIVYGGWGAPTRLTTPTATVYNDNVWHHLVVTATGASGGTQTSSIYVDGVLIISGTTTATSNYTGFWRVGSGSLGTGGSYPTSVAFEGTIDHVAVYPTVLTAAQVAAHYAAR